MSVSVMTWVWRQSTATGNDRLVLLAIADAADDEGRNAWPSIATLAAKTRLDERTVRRIVRRLETEGHIEVDRAGGGRYSNTYRVLSTPRADCPGLVSTPRAERPGYPGQDAPAPRAQAPGHPGHRRPPTRPRTVLEPPPPAHARDTGTAAPADDGGGGIDGRVGEIFAALGEAWPLSGSQRARLTPAIDTALTAGWLPRDLAAHLGGNTAGVRHPYAVLQKRLADLPDPSTSTPPRPPWCGTCDPATRHRDDARGRPARCPTCHPLAVGGGAG